MARILSSRLKKLRDRAEREVNEGLLPSCQLSLAFEGEIVFDECFGESNDETRYAFFSATKPMVTGTICSLMGDGLLDPKERVASYIPEFSSNGKESVTVEQVMLHTSGFPYAPLGPPAWESSEGRLTAFERWRLDWPPGTRYEYHATSAHWVLAEIIERASGKDFRKQVEERVTEPAGLPKVLGIPEEEQSNIAELVPVGELASPEELYQAFGVSELPVDPSTTEDLLLLFNDPKVRALGVPGAGGIGRAADLAMFYQAVLHNTGEMWHPQIHEDVTGKVRNRLPDLLSGAPANRTLGFFQAGEDGFAHVRGLGRTVSPLAVGHNGAGGQLAWGDPSTGLSFGYVTNGLDRHQLRQPRRGTAISSLAALCTAE